MIFLWIKHLTLKIFEFIKETASFKVSNLTGSIAPEILNQ